MDNPAGTQISRQSLDRINRYLLECNANHEGAFATSQHSDAVLHEAHAAMADFLNAASPDALLAAAALLAVAVPSRAEVQGSPHDIIPQGYDVLKTGLSEDRCTRCHLPVSTDGPNLLRHVPPSLQRHSPASLLCFSCHDGTTIVSPEVDASATAFHPASHAMAEVAEERRPPEGVGLPLAPGYRIDCVTCHDPHTNTHRPFLRAERAELCLVCHGAYAETSLGRDNLTGNHVLAADPLGPGRPEAPLPRMMSR